jgi:hypothetical protein
MPFVLQEMLGLVRNELAVCCVSSLLCDVSALQCDYPLACSSVSSVVEVGMLQKESSS